MTAKIYSNIVALVRQAQKLAKSIGIDNILQPGLVKEMIIADILGHELISSKHDADAHASDDPNKKYEYLTCAEGGTGQIDRVSSRPPDKRKKSLQRIVRNSKIYVAVFYKNDQLKCKVIYEIEPSVMLDEANRKLDRSKNDMSHLSFSVKWAEKNGKVVYEDDSQES